jgi:hypothetical protein
LYDRWSSFSTIISWLYQLVPIEQNIYGNYTFGFVGEKYPTAKDLQINRQNSVNDKSGEIKLTFFLVRFTFV